MQKLQFELKYFGRKAADAIWKHRSPVAPRGMCGNTQHRKREKAPTEVEVQDQVTPRPTRPRRGRADELEPGRSDKEALSGATMT